MGGRSKKTMEELQNFGQTCTTYRGGQVYLKKWKDQIFCFDRRVAAAKPLLLAQ